MNRRALAGVACIEFLARVGLLLAGPLGAGAPAVNIQTAADGAILVTLAEEEGSHSTDRDGVVHVSLGSGFPFRSLRIRQIPGGVNVRSRCGQTLVGFVGAKVFLVEGTKADIVVTPKGDVRVEADKDNPAPILANGRKLCFGQSHVFARVGGSSKGGREASSSGKKTERSEGRDGRETE